MMDINGKKEVFNTFFHPITKKENRTNRNQSPLQIARERQKNLLAIARKEDSHELSHKLGKSVPTTPINIGAKQAKSRIFKG